MPAHRVVGPAVGETLELPVQWLVPATDGQGANQRLDQTPSDERWNGGVGAGEPVRATRRITGPELVAPVAAEGHRDLFSRDAAEQVRWQQRRVGHRLVEASE